MNNKEEIKGIFERHKLGEILSINPVQEGVLNENYIINTTTGKFFLKYYKNKNPEEIKYISSIESFMKKADIPTISAMATDYEEGWMLYNFVESDRNHSYNLEDYYKMGQMLGRIHLASFNREIPEYMTKVFYKENLERSSAVNRMKEYIIKINRKDTIDDIDKLFLIYIEKKLSYVNKFGDEDMLLNDTLVHGDFHAGNLLIDKNTREIIGICDWEKSQYAPRAYDLARAYLYIGFGTNTDDVDECLDIGENVLKGYRSIIKISDDEFKRGLLMRLKNNVFTTWIEDKYYISNNTRANKFIKNSILTLDYFFGK